MSRRVSAVVLAASVAALAAAASAVSATRLPGFPPPAATISCLFVPSAPAAVGGRTPATLLCRIAHADYGTRLQDRCMGPTGAGVDWHGFELVGAGKGAVLCSGGILYNPTTQRPGYVTLAYGKTWRQKMFSCASQVNGVNCS